MAQAKWPSTVRRMLASTGERRRANTERVFTGIALAAALVAHGLVGLFILFSGLVAHPALWGAGLLAWGFGVYVIVRWKRRPGRVTFVPSLLAAAYFLVLLVGERVGLVGA